MQRLMPLPPPPLPREQPPFLEIWATGAGELGQLLFLRCPSAPRGQPRTAAAHGPAVPGRGAVGPAPLSPALSLPGPLPPWDRPRLPEPLRPRLGEPSSAPLREGRAANRRCSDPSAAAASLAGPGATRHNPTGAPSGQSAPRRKFLESRGVPAALTAPNVFGRPCKQSVVAISAGDPGRSVCSKRKVPRCCRASPARAAEARKQRNRKHMTWVCCLLWTRGAHDVSTAGVKKKEEASGTTGLHAGEARALCPGRGRGPAWPSHAPGWDLALGTQGNPSACPPASCSPCPGPKHRTGTCAHNHTPP